MVETRMHANKLLPSNRNLRVVFEFLIIMGTNSLLLRGLHFLVM